MKSKSSPLSLERPLPWEEKEEITPEEKAEILAEAQKYSPLLMRLTRISRITSLVFLFWCLLGFFSVYFILPFTPKNIFMFSLVCIIAPVCYVDLAKMQEYTGLKYLEENHEMVAFNRKVFREGTSFSMVYLVVLLLSYLFGVDGNSFLSFIFTSPDLIVSNIWMEMAYAGIVIMAFSFAPMATEPICYLFLFNFPKRVQDGMNALKAKIAKGEADKQEKSDYLGYRMAWAVRLGQRIVLAVGALVFLLGLILELRQFFLFNF